MELNFKPGDTVFSGRYRLLESLDDREIPLVWLVEEEDLKSKRRVIKFLPFASELSEDERLKFVDVVGQAARMIHPSIVRTYDVLSENSLLAIVMEYVPGKSFSRLFREGKEGQVRPEQLRTWIQQICEALQYARNEHELVHCGIVPSRIVINEKNDVRVLGFWMAEGDLLSARQLAKANQDEEEVLFAYSSPQYKHESMVHPSDEVYSIGAILFESITGERPFPGVNVGGGDDLALDPPSFSDVIGIDAPTLKEFSGEWERLVRKCLAPKQEDRFQSPSDLLKAVESLPVPDEEIIVEEPAIEEWATMRFDEHETVAGKEPEIENSDSTEEGEAEGQSDDPADYSEDREPDEVEVEEDFEPEPQDKRRPVFFYVVLVGIFLIGVGTILFFLPDGEKTVVQISSNPTGATVHDVATGHRLGVTPIEIDGLSPGERKFSFSKAGYEPRTVSLIIREKKTVSTSPSLVAKEGMDGASDSGNGTAPKYPSSNDQLGRVLIRSTPSGAVVKSAGGSVVGRTPLTLDGVPYGSLSYEVQKEGYREETVSGSLNSSKLELSATLTLDAGTVKISSSPSGASIYSSSQEYLGKTPATLEYQAAGYRTYQLQMSGYEDTSVSGQLSGGETLSLSKTLNKEVGSVYLSSSPSGASVYSSSGSWIGTTPLELKSVNPGFVSYEFQKDGYKTESASGSVTPGDRLSLSADLKRELVPYRVIYSGSDGVFVRSHPQTGEIFAAAYANDGVAMKVYLVGEQDYRSDGSIWGQFQLEGWMVTSSSTYTYMVHERDNIWRVTWYKNDKDKFVNMRSYPSLDAAKVGEANDGTRIVAMKQQNVGGRLWIYGGFLGWMCIKTNTGNWLLERD
ncbi:MAG: hypothetical protein CMO55_09875 [Verrucomicrobiales bacterium]|nr:hypothetical protein [Verrucomicrobiales bacterium]